MKIIFLFFVLLCHIYSEETYNVIDFFVTYRRIIPKPWKSWFAQSEPYLNKPLTVDEFVTKFMNLDKGWDSGKKFLKRYRKHLSPHWKCFLGNCTQKIDEMSYYNITHFFIEYYEVVPNNWKFWFNMNDRSDISYLDSITINDFIQNFLKEEDDWKDGEKFVKDEDIDLEHYENFFNRIIDYLNERGEIEYDLHKFLKKYSSIMSDHWKQLFININKRVVTIKEFFYRYFVYLDDIEEFERFYVKYYNTLNPHWRGFLRKNINLYHQFWKTKRYVLSDLCYFLDKFMIYEDDEDDKCMEWLKYKQKKHSFSYFLKIILKELKGNNLVDEINEYVNRKAKNEDIVWKIFFIKVVELLDVEEVSNESDEDYSYSESTPTKKYFNKHTLLFQ